MSIEWIFVAVAVAVAVAIAAVIGWGSAYQTGIQHGRMLQATEDRHEVELAVIALARAEQLTRTWEARARALLFAYTSKRKS